MINIIKGKFIDISGQKFNMLTAIKCVSLPKDQMTWEFKCDCGNITIKKKRHIVSGTIKSCGCLQKESIKNTGKNNKGYNTYDLTGNYGIGYTQKGEEFYFDLEDYDKIKDYYWLIDDKNYVARSNKVKMHRLILNVTDKNVEVDHIYHNTNDNRKSQLRLVNRSQNQMNRVIAKNNTSGFKGVYWSNSKNKWEASITYNQNVIYLGCFSDINEAINIRQHAEKEYFGEFRYEPIN